MTPKDTAEMFKELDAITEGTGLNVNTTSEIVQVDEGDANSFDTKLEEIVGDFDTWCKCGGDDCLRYNNYKSAKQAIKQLIDSKVREARDATRRLYDKELEMHRGFMASVLTRENLKTNVTLTLCSRCSTELTKAKEVK